MSRAWTAVDFETANPDRGSVCAVGLVRVVDGAVVERYSTLVRPPEPVRFFSPRHTAVHGIRAADVARAPQWPEVLERITALAGDDPLVAHNAAFDVGVLRAACAHTGLARPALSYACTLALARRAWAELPDHRLPTVCGRIGWDMAGRHHRADADAEAAARIVLAAMEATAAASLGALAAALNWPLQRLAGGRDPRPAAPSGGSRAGDRFAAWQEASRAELPEADPGADPSGPFYGRTVCISGDLDGIPKPDAWRRIAEAGGHPAKNVTRATDVLVVADSTAGAPTAKQRRAEDYRARGQAIEIIGEREFTARLALAGG
ncbi:exonuclease domain-containing protein [Streptomonospora nanhaiensis]|uniref:DNA polymerase-3 subunit epsilon n=1 Tax=Streptomonospora nanhaiensis TaxID=1323731 RepID=A0A853BHY5_9ACTN|nr:exonuclease domain-containing protein [Streptomonospora nanhaiensis]MBV2366395.1 DNA polymerase III [Streptomonospora nanhaiensis]MBX9390411.1 DNA polymerase III [Streptomonospora nanhaiensis]NYI94212.1 DNA polymerase-3 subunit epsilon [Streptomonospora nanhaiensis]